MVFRAKPGIAGPTQLALAAESELLGLADPEEDYRTRILPAKVALDVRYLHARLIGLDHAQTGGPN
jgi:lipopolysaccharide/colanic/teichoic acid biosynthesis glycosyltransferase